MRLRYFAVFLMTCVLGPEALAYDTGTHMEMNQTIIDNLTSMGGANLKALLKRSGLFPMGIEQVVDGKEIQLWIKEGGKEEDEPFPRLLNHFFDPVLGRRPWWPSIPTTDWALGDNELWYHHNDYSIDHVFENYLLGTVGVGRDPATNYYRVMAPDSADRSDHLARAFQGLGQVMHLVEDMTDRAPKTSSTEPRWSTASPGRSPATSISTGIPRGLADPLLLNEKTS